MNHYYDLSKSLNLEASTWRYMKPCAKSRSLVTSGSQDVSSLTKRHEVKASSWNDWQLLQIKSSHHLQILKKSVAISGDLCHFLQLPWHAASSCRGPARISDKPRTQKSWCTCCISDQQPESELHLQCVRAEAPAATIAGTALHWSLPCCKLTYQDIPGITRLLSWHGGRFGYVRANQKKKKILRLFKGESGLEGESTAETALSSLGTASKTLPNHLWPL